MLTVMKAVKPRCVHPAVPRVSIAGGSGRAHETCTDKEAQ